VVYVPNGLAVMAVGLLAIAPLAWMVASGHLKPWDSKRWKFVDAFNMLGCMCAAMGCSSALSVVFAHKLALGLVFDLRQVNSITLGVVILLRACLYCCWCLLGWLVWESVRWTHVASPWLRPDWLRPKAIVVGVDKGSSTAHLAGTVKNLLKSLRMLSAEGLQKGSSAARQLVDFGLEVSRLYRAFEKLEDSLCRFTLSFTSQLRSRFGSEGVALEPCTLCVWLFPVEGQDIPLFHADLEQSHSTEDGFVTIQARCVLHLAAVSTIVRHLVKPELAGFRVGFLIYVALSHNLPVHCHCSC
jgi:hypothetical protein